MVGGGWWGVAVGLIIYLFPHIGHRYLLLPFSPCGAGASYIAETLGLRLNERVCAAFRNDMSTSPRRGWVIYIPGDTEDRILPAKSKIHAIPNFRNGDAGAQRE